MSLEAMKAEARELRVHARSLGSPISHSRALEQIARKHGFSSWRACVAIKNHAINPSTLPEVSTTVHEMERYINDEWSFDLDIPKSWNVFPPVHANSPWEVVRFFSREDGTHNLIVFRSPRDPEESIEAHIDSLKNVLASQGFDDFVVGVLIAEQETIATLDFDRKTDDAPHWNCRYFFFNTKTLRYTLGFGSTDKDVTLDLCKTIAKSFRFNTKDSEPRSGGRMRAVPPLSPT